MSDTLNLRPQRFPARKLRTTTHLGTDVVVRQWDLSDLDSYHAAMHASYEHLLPWMPWAAAEPQEIEAHEVILNRFASTWDFDDFVYGMFVDGQVVGGSGLHNRVGPHGWEIGYWVHADFEGRGIVGAVVRVLTNEAFLDHLIECVEIRCDAMNQRSANVPRRQGYTLVAEEQRVPVAQGETDLTHVYRVTRNEWFGSVGRT